MIHIVSVVGARPQFIKLAPLERAISASGGIRHSVIHTGQHYDTNLSDVFFEDFNLPKPTFNLGIGSGSHGHQTGKMLAGIEDILVSAKPDIVVIFGDTNSTLAAALAAAKLHIPVAHIEAGLRSFNRTMPEEINRVVADHTSDLLLAPTQTAMENLEKEGLGEKAVYTGDIMLDAVLQAKALIRDRKSIAESLGLIPKKYALVSVHRAANTDDPIQLVEILNTLNLVAETKLPLIFPVHPRTRQKISQLPEPWVPHERFHLVEPSGYLDFQKLITEAAMVLTDSGGVQKEAFFHQCPCITMREETEWTETVAAKANILTGASKTRILEAVSKWQARLSSGPLSFENTLQTYFGNGNSAELTLSSIFSLLNK